MVMTPNAKLSREGKHDTSNSKEKHQRSLETNRLPESAAALVRLLLERPTYEASNSFGWNFECGFLVLTCLRFAPLFASGRGS